MKVTVLGTGMVGQAVAGRLAELGHEVTMGTRDVAATTARTEPDGMGNPPVSAWLADHPAVRLASYSEAAVGADLIVNATTGSGSIAALEAVGPDGRSGRVLLDIANPLDFSAGFPPTLTVKDTDCLAEQIQRAFPDLRVVKALNTLTAALMVHPELVGGGDHTVFVSGDDAQAKQVVVDLLGQLGHRDVIDLGALSTARGTEMLLPLWVRLMAALGTPMFQLKVVRATT
jgi:predicted dinucleotide-binding enzyme